MLGNCVFDLVCLITVSLITSTVSQYRSKMVLVGSQSYLMVRWEFLQSKGDLTYSYSIMTKFHRETLVTICKTYGTSHKVILHHLLGILGYYVICRDVLISFMPVTFFLRFCSQTLPKRKPNAQCNRGFKFNWISFLTAWINRRTT